jgi:hypothetical protein
VQSIYSYIAYQLKLLYFLYFHSVMRYGITFSGSPSTAKIYLYYKRNPSILVGVKPRNSYGGLEILYFSVILCVCEFLYYSVTPIGSVNTPHIHRFVQHVFAHRAIIRYSGQCRNTTRRIQVNV